VTQDSSSYATTAVLSPSREYRYTLTREWNEARDILNVIGLNPSTADETQDDPTIRRCVGFARRWGFGKLVMTNLFAIRATYPAALYAAAEPVGPENDAYLRETARNVTAIVCAWGAHGELHGRGAAVAKALTQAGVLLNVFGFTQNGQPKHPLYLKAILEPSPWVYVP
jgi:hypothetical protein